MIPAYVVTFPYGQCRAWTDHELGCFSKYLGLRVTVHVGSHLTL